MTAKEKAEELYFKYKEALNIRHDMRIGANPFAQQCALIAVNMLMEEFGTYYIINSGGKNEIYWEEVKKEIELL